MKDRQPSQGISHTARLSDEGLQRLEEVMLPAFYVWLAAQAGSYHGAFSYSSKCVYCQ
jgi:uncharacterized membrane protein YoaT (DUF817 family)